MKTTPKGVSLVNIKKFISAAMIVTVGAVSMPLSAVADDNTSYVESHVYVMPTTNNAQKGPASKTPANTNNQLPDLNNTYISLKDAMKGIGVNVKWHSVPTPFITLQKDSVTVQVMIDEANTLLGTQSDSFVYKLEEGKLYVPVSFVAYVLGNANVTYNAQDASVTIQAKDSTQAITFQNLDAYKGSVDESNSDSDSNNSYTYYQSGQATWYGSAVQGNLTASGEVFNMYDYTCAHNSLPFGTKVRVTDVDTGKTVIVRVTDRGGFGGSRIIDLSWQAANDLGIVSKGVANVTLEIVG